MSLEIVSDIFEDKTKFTLLLTVFVVLITTGLLWFFKRKPSSKKNVLILGASNAGKTALFCQIVYNKRLLTQISITPNVGVATLQKPQASKQLKLDIVDIPGQEKVHIKFFRLYKRTARSIVFVVDSSTFHKDSKDVAQYLYEFLSDEYLSSAKLNVLVVCNKQDIELAKSESFIKSNLEKEIELLRKISSSALKSTDAKSSNSQVSSGPKLRSSEDKPFEFKDLKYFNFDFCEANGLSEDGIVKVKSWLLKNA